MANKTIKAAVTCGECRPAARASFDLDDMPDGMPAVGKPVTLVVQGELTRLSKNELSDSKSASIGVKVKKVTVGKVG